MQKSLFTPKLKHKMPIDPTFIAVNGIMWPFISLMFIAFLYFRSRNKIRMALIESGRDAQSLEPLRRDKSNSLKWGVVAVMAGLGLLVGNVLEAVGMQEVVAYFAPLLLFIGIGLVGYYSFQSKQEEQERDNDSLV